MTVGPLDAAGAPDSWRRSHQFIHLLNGRWAMAVLAELTRGGRRYQDIYDTLDGISYKVLTDTLRRAERDGLIARQLDPGRVETATLYQLTDLGRSLDEPLTTLGRWVDSNWTSVDAARRQWDQRTDGR
jgi:DNA-binding HxlR family transcriptional regulator